MPSGSGWRGEAVRRGIVALIAGFTGAIAVTSAVAVLWRVTGLIDAHTLASSTGTEYIYQPGWFSVITALVARAAGTLSLTSAKSAALVGVFISVTTIPAAGDRRLALVSAVSTCRALALQLLINLTGIVISSYLVLLAQSRPRGPGERDNRNVTTS